MGCGKSRSPIYLKPPHLSCANVGALYVILISDRKTASQLIAHAANRSMLFFILLAFGALLITIHQPLECFKKPVELFSVYRVVCFLSGNVRYDKPTAHQKV